MYKGQLISVLSSQTGVPYSTVEKVIDAFTNKTAQLLTLGEPLVIHGFGTFEPKSRSQRIGRNPHTTEPVIIPARVMPSFKPSPGLVEQVSGVACKTDSESLHTSPMK